MISITGMCKAYGTADTSLLTVLRNISLSIDAGEFVAIMGPSGSGKSTLLNIIGCLDTFDSGSYLFQQTAVNTLSSDELARLRAQKFGFVFQNFNLIQQFTALANVELPMMYGNRNKHERRIIASAHLQRVGLADRKSHRPNELSGGQQQRVAIARALVNDPDVLIADEPTGSLDSENGREIMQLFTQLHDQGKIIIIVTHEESIAAYASRVIRMKDGEIVSEGVAA